MKRKILNIKKLQRDLIKLYIKLDREAIPMYQILKKRNQIIQKGVLMFTEKVRHEIKEKLE